MRAPAAFEGVQVVRSTNDAENLRPDPPDHPVLALRELVCARVFTKLPLRDIQALQSTSRAFRVVIQSAPDHVFHAAAERSGLPGTLFLANPGSASQRVHQAARVHNALRARTHKPAVQCAPAPWFLCLSLTTL